ncbi:MAG: hypothetical protein K6G44_04835 [Lentisphaeria bacterium]|nr:hypothetical protein [Lentisphaeria bacterium]
MVELSGVFKDSMNLKNGKDSPKRMEFTTFLKLFSNVRIVFNNQRMLGGEKKTDIEKLSSRQQKAKILVSMQNNGIFLYVSIKISERRNGNDNLSHNHGNHGQSG